MPGDPLPNGNAENGLSLFRKLNDTESKDSSCVVCHSLPLGSGTDRVFNGEDFDTLPQDPSAKITWHWPTCACPPLAR